VLDECAIVVGLHPDQVHPLYTHYTLTIHSLYTHYTTQ
jgi:hypothetical protein